MTGRTRRDAHAPPDGSSPGEWVSTALARFDPLIPPAIAAQGGADLLRARMAAAAMCGASLLYGLNGVYLLLAESQLGVAIVDVASAAGLVGSFWLFRRIRRQDFFASIFIAIAVGQIMFLWLASGGANLGALFSLSAVILASMVLASWRFGLAFTLFVGVMVGTSFALLPIDPSAPSTVFDGNPYRDALLLMFGVGAFAILYDWTREVATRAADEARGRAEASERAARQATEVLATVAAISGRLQRSHGSALEREIDASVVVAAGLAGARRAVLNIFDVRLKAALAQHVSARADDNFSALDPELVARCRWSTGKLSAGELIAISDRDELPPEAEVEHELLEARGIRGWLVLPVRVGRRYGYFAFESRERRDWSQMNLEPLQLLGEILGAAVTQRQDELARVESEEKFAKAFSANPDGMLLTDIETGTVAECNDRLLRLAEVDRDWLEGRTAQDLVQRLDTLRVGPLEPRMSQLQRALDDDVPNEEEVRVRTSEGIRVYIMSSAIIEIGSRRNLLTTVRDVTERRELETQLLQAQKMEAVGRLAGGVAHDFNNMLTVIQGRAEGLRDTVGDEHGEELDAIKDAVDRSAALTRRLLTFSRRQMLHPTRVDLRELVGRVDAMLRSVIGEDIHLETRAGDAPAVIEVDESQMEQALLNLVVNARDAIDAGGHIVVATERIDADGVGRGVPAGPYVRLRVEDDGCGMDEDILGRVLDPFFTTKQEGKGSGLGLSMVDGFVRQSGGTLSIRSQVGGGTVVEVFLPCVGFAATERVRDEPPDEDAGTTGTVLLVEDEDALRRLARRALESAGHTVIEARDGLDALDRAAAFDEPIDVLLTDAVMPRLGGFDLAERLGRERPGLRVLVMSGYPEGSRGGDGPPPGFEILPKPFSPSLLRREIARLLKEQS